MKKMTTFLGGALIAAALLLSGCQNFLTANAEAREKLRAEADYNRASSIKVSAHVENNSHGVIAKTVTGAKVGYPFQVGFNCSDDYYVKGWIVKDGDHTLSNETDYTVQEMGNGTYEITVKSSVSNIELIPECYKQPAVYFSSPMIIDESTNEFVARGISSISGRNTVKVNQPRDLTWTPDNGFGVKKFIVKKNDVELTDFSELIEFYDAVLDKNTYNIKIKVLSHLADGIEIVPIVELGSSSLDDTNMSNLKISSIKADWTDDFYGTIYPVPKENNPESFKMFESGKESSYVEVKSQGCRIYIKKESGNDIKSFYIETRCMKVSEDSLFKNKNGQWVEGKDIGQVFSSGYVFTNMTGFDEADFKSVDNKTVVSSGTNYDTLYQGNNVYRVPLEINVPKVGWIQWNVWAVDASGRKSSNSIVFTAKFSYVPPKYYDGDTDVEFNPGYFSQLIIFDDNEHSNGAHIASGEKLVINITAGNKTKYNVISFSEVGRSAPADTTIDSDLIKFYGRSNERNERFSRIAGCSNGYKSSTMLKWKVSPIRGVNNTIECYWINNYGKKGQSKIFSYAVPDGYPGEIALGKVKRNIGDAYYSIDYVTYMNKTSYDSWGKNLDLVKIGYVYYADEKNILVLNPTLGGESKWAYSGEFLDTDIGIKCLPINGYSVERDYENIRKLHEQLSPLKTTLSGSTTKVPTYTAINSAYNTFSKYSNTKIVDIGWYLPSVDIIRRYISSQAKEEINKWTDSPIKSAEYYWTCTTEDNGYGNYSPMMYKSGSYGREKPTTSKYNIYVGEDLKPIKILTITNLADKRYREVTKD